MLDVSENGWRQRGIIATTLDVILTLIAGDAVLRFVKGKVAVGVVADVVDCFFVECIYTFDDSVVDA